MARSVGRSPSRDDRDVMGGGCNSIYELTLKSERVIVFNVVGAWTAFRLGELN